MGTSIQQTYGKILYLLSIFIENSNHKHGTNSFMPINSQFVAYETVSSIRWNSEFAAMKLTFPDLARIKKPYSLYHKDRRVLTKILLYKIVNTKDS